MITESTRSYQRRTSSPDLFERAVYLIQCILAQESASTMLDLSEKSAEALDLYQVILDGRLHHAMPDNQASANIMSLDFAWREGIKVEAFKAPFVLGDGSTQFSVGRALVDCALPLSSHSPRLHEFYVLLALTAPLILGRKFLHESHIVRWPSVNTNASDLVDTDGDLRSIRTSTSLDHIEHSTWHVKATLRLENSVLEGCVVPDQGADLNCMSLKYAQDINVAVKPCHKLKDTLVCVANGCAVTVVGFVDMSVQFYGKAARRFGQITMRFAVIANLYFHLVLGKPAITKFKILEDTASFEWVHIVDQSATLCGVNERKIKGPVRKVPDPTQDATNEAVDSALQEQKKRYMQAIADAMEPVALPQHGNNHPQPPANAGAALEPDTAPASTPADHVASEPRDFAMHGARGPGNAHEPGRIGTNDGGAQTAGPETESNAIGRPNGDINSGGKEGRPKHFDWHLPSFHRTPASDERKSSKKRDKKSRSTMAKEGPSQVG